MLLSPKEAKALISEHTQFIADLTKKIAGMREIVNKKYEHGLMCWWDDGLEELREDAKKYFNDIDTQSKGNILRDLEHQIKKDKKHIKILQQELKFVEAGGRLLDF